MGSYTLELREIIEQPTQFENMSHTERIEKGRSNLFDFPYPIFDENYRNVFETNFIRNFYMREIGFETEGLFKFRLETWLNINMPYFNKMFESELITYDPLTNVSNSVKHDKTNDKIQKDIIDKVIEQIKNGTRNDNRNIITSGNVTTNQDDDRNIQQNDNRHISDNVNKDIRQDDDIVKTQNEKENIKNQTDATQDTNNKTDSSGTTDSESKVNDVGTKTADNDTNNFVRDLESTTPDNRLAITTADGAGVIEYASKIDEKKEKKYTKTNDKTVQDIKNESTDKTVTQSEQIVNTENLEQFEGDRLRDLDENEKLIRNIHDTLTGNKMDDLDSRTSDLLKRLITEVRSGSTGDTLLGTIKEILNSTANETLNRSVNDIENFAQYSFGKIGVVSYPQLVKEFRESFLRIERDIFNEMNELFMLVY